MENSSIDKTRDNRMINLQVPTTHLQPLSTPGQSCSAHRIPGSEFQAAFIQVVYNARSRERRGPGPSITEKSESRDAERGRPLRQVGNQKHVPWKPTEGRAPRKRV